MRPYLLEGLDCSGKKTVAALITEHFLQTGEKPVTCYIGPMVPSPLSLLDDRLTHIRRRLRRGEVTDILRRCVYLAGPVVDGLFFHVSEQVTPLKVSSHYRAYARAIIQNDEWMVRWFERIHRWSISFGGCTHLTVPFQVRIERHRQDVTEGRTKKQESIRFLNHDEEAFTRWDDHLLRLLSAHVPYVQSISSAALSPEALAQQVIDHIIFCKRQGVIP